MSTSPATASASHTSSEGDGDWSLRTTPAMERYDQKQATSLRLKEDPDPSSTSNIAIPGNRCRKVVHRIGSGDSFTPTC